VAPAVRLGRDTAGKLAAEDFRVSAEVRTAVPARAWRAVRPHRGTGSLGGPGDRVLG